jgi:hypothetical protein
MMSSALKYNYEFIMVRAFLLLLYKIITLFAAARRGRCLVIIRRIEFLNRYSRGQTDSIPTIEELVAEL